jgi:threonine dehydratase
VALAAQLLGCPALIVMPSDSPKVKVEGTRGFGAQIRFYDRFTEDRVAIAKEIADERGCVVVPSYDDPHIIAGQGTAGLEIVEQARALGVALDKVLSPVGGGGLIAGVSTAVKALSPATEVWGAEPAGFDETRRSLATGKRETIDEGARSICDALLQPEVRAAYRALLDQGWTDALRAVHPDGPLWTFWAYLRNRWPNDKGLRLDHLLLTPDLAERLADAGVDRWPRGEEDASDHAPTWIALDL